MAMPSRPGPVLSVVALAVALLVGAAGEACAEGATDDELAAVRKIHEVARKAHAKGKRADAERGYRTCIELLAKALGPDSPKVATVENNLGQLLFDSGDGEGALTRHEKALAIRRKALGKDDPKVAASEHQVGVCLAALERRSEAERHLRQALRIREKGLGADHPHVAESLEALAEVLVKRDRPSLAMPLLARARTILRQKLGKAHPRLARVAWSLAEASEALGRLPDAEHHLNRAVGVMERSVGKGHRHLARYLNRLAGVAAELRQRSRAEALYLRALAIRRKAYGTRHHLVVAVEHNLARLKIDDDPAAAAKTLEGLLGTLEGRVGAQHVFLAPVLEGCALALRKAGEAAKAGKMQDRAKLLRREAAKSLVANHLMRRDLAEFHERGPRL